MRFEWDEQKNLQNIHKHGLSFADAEEIFEYPMLTALDERENYGEERWIGVGILKGRTAVVAFTQRDEETVRIISLRKALKHERAKYEKLIYRLG